MPTACEFQSQGKQGAGVLQETHAEDGMVNVCKSLCAYDLCTKSPPFNVGESKTAAYCKQHAEDNMVGQDPDLVA